MGKAILKGREEETDNLPGRKIGVIARIKKESRMGGK
jgi:hypothetical protein